MGHQTQSPGRGAADGPVLNQGPPLAVAAAPIPTGMFASHAIRPGDLVTALSIQAMHRAPLGDVLRAHGLASESQITTAMARRHGTGLLLPADGPPDPRLIDRIGPARCLAIGIVPWRRLGAVTLVASCRPDNFARYRDELVAEFGPLAMAIVSEADLQGAILNCRRSSLTLLAERCVPDPLSCRAWNGRRFNTGVLIGATGLAVAGWLAPSLTLAAVFLIVTLAVMASTALKLAAAVSHARMTTPPPARTQAQPAAQPTPALPSISILVPMFRETDIAPRLVRRLGALSYPRELLDVILVLEEDDLQTRSALAASDLPHWMRIIPVPHASLRTKPRAMNYALAFARGSVVGVYDAEDAPEPDQLHRVARHFQQAAPDVACLQGALDYYNPRINWISRCFTIEYAVWFRKVLPGLDRLGLVVPLGGTTLFFRRHILEALGGWDAHNVTEDADLGIRLARAGYRTELIDTVTREEANCRTWPWIKQRSRWLKGYAMTYAVHMREPLTLYRQLGARGFWGVQAIFLGTLIQFFLAPLLWSAWFLLFGLDHPIAAILPGWVIAMATILFLGSEVIGIAIAWSALDRTSHRWLRPWALTLTVYYPLAALAAYKAAWEMLTTPFYWDKTAHGLHDTKGRQSGPGRQDVPSVAAARPIA